MWPAVIWLAAGLVLASAEVLSGEFVLLMLGGGAVAAGVGALLGIGVAGSALVFVVVSVLLVFAVRPALRRRLDRSTEHAALHSDALVGRSAVVVVRVDDHNGRVRVGGDVWTARPLDPGGHAMEQGESVTIVRISGATALVVPERGRADPG